MLGVRAQVLAREVGADGFLLASSEPNTLTRLPPLLLPLPTYVMPARHFVDVPEGKTPHQVEEEEDPGSMVLFVILLLSTTATATAIATTTAATDTTVASYDCNYYHCFGYCYCCCYCYCYSGG